MLGCSPLCELLTTKRDSVWSGTITVNPHHPPLPKRIGNVITYTSKSSFIFSMIMVALTFIYKSVQISNVFMMRNMYVFLQCDYSFHDLSLRHAYLSIYYTSCFYNHYTALTMDTPSSARVATARLTILDRLVPSKVHQCHIHLKA